MDERIVILALTGNFSSPSTRLRIIEMAKYLKKFNIFLNIYRYPNNILKFHQILTNNNYDFLWIQKKLPDFFKFWVLKFIKAPIIFDFDDNLTVRMKPKKGSYKSSTREFKFNLIKKISSGFTCGNNFLKSLITDTKKPYFIYPTPVPINVPVKKIFKLNNLLKIGWIGLSGGFMYLEKIFPQLEKLYSEVDFEFVIVSDKLYRPECKFIKNIKWQLETQEKEISKFDLGIMPLNTNSPYDKGKCSYKILQYMASGVIPVGEAYGTNLDIIDNGKNGFLIYNNLWYQGLKDIILKLKNEKLDYSLISKNALNTAKKFSFEYLASNLADFLKRFNEKRRNS